MNKGQKILFAVSIAGIAVSIAGTIVCIIAFILKLIDEDYFAAVCDLLAALYCLGLAVNYFQSRKKIISREEDHAEKDL